MGRSDSHGARALALAFAAVVLSFVVATGYAEYRDIEVSRLAATIADESSPAIEHLAAGRAEVRRLQAMAWENTRLGAPLDEQELRDTLRRARTELDAYQRLPSVDNEEQWRQALHDATDALDVDVDGLIAKQRARATGDLKALELSVRDHSHTVSQVGLQLLQMHADRSRAAALRIERVRSAAMWIAFVLDGAAVLITALTAYLLVASLRRQQRMAAIQHELVANKAAELEQFSARVAHDIAGPISAALMSLELAAKTNSRDQLVALQARTRRALVRVSEISQALLEFARSGARPDPEARCSVAAVVAGVTDELQAQADNAGVTLGVAPAADCEVACGRAILSTILANLVQNAIKYGRGVPLPRVTVRTIGGGDRVRFEVEDNGIGIDRQLESKVFDPYVRAPGNLQGGMGLGLATVKRLVTSHGGTVGVVNRPGQGCTFWFELPRA